MTPTKVQVLVVGAGPAGIAAAAAAAENGQSVIVLDDNLAAGGQIWRGATQPAQKAEDVPEKRRAIERLSRSGARVLTGRSVFDASASGSLRALRTNGTKQLIEEYRFKQLIIATGARERFLPFPGWTAPGVFGAGGLQALVKGGYAVAGKRVVVSGTGPLLLAVAAHLAQDGAIVTQVLEQASLSSLLPFAASLLAHPAKILQGIGYRAQLRKTPYRTGHWVTEAIPSNNGEQLSGVRITDGAKSWVEPCDLLACGYHLVPNTELATLLGCSLEGDNIRVDAAQRTSLSGIFCVGEPTGIAGLDAALLQGEIAGLTAAGRNIHSLLRRATRERSLGSRMSKAFALRKELLSLPWLDTIICRCEDVAFGDLKGHNSWTDAKLQTRCGMGPCQGRVCGPAIEHLLGWKPVSVRQPLSPVPLQSFCPEVELNAPQQNS